MSMTTDAPAWINLDALAPQVIRDEIRHLIQDIESTRDQMTGLTARFIEVTNYVDVAEETAVRQYQALVPNDDQLELDDPGGAIWNLVHVVTGYRRLFNEMQELSDLADPDRLTMKRTDGEAAQPSEEQ